MSSRGQTPRERLWAAYLESDADSFEEFLEQQGGQEESKAAGDQESKSRRERVSEAASAGREKVAEKGREAASSATKSAKRRLLEAAAAAGAGGIATDEFVDRRKKSRNQEVVERAERAATMAPPTNHTLEILGTGAVASHMARAGMGMGAADLERRDGAAGPAPGLDPGVGSVDPRVEAGLMSAGYSGHADPDWHDNPDHLDTPAEVREGLMEAGLDPMDVDTEQQALFGHALVHGYANDPDLGGRTPAQLEAEHDLVVAAMDDYGFDHDSPLDVHSIFGITEEEL